MGPVGKLPPREECLGIGGEVETGVFPDGALRDAGVRQREPFAERGMVAFGECACDVQGEPEEPVGFFHAGVLGGFGGAVVELLRQRGGRRHHQRRAYLQRERRETAESGGRPDVDEILCQARANSYF